MSNESLEFQDIMQSLSKDKEIPVIEPRIGSLDNLTGLLHSIKNENKDKKPGDGWKMSSS